MARKRMALCLLATICMVLAGCSTGSVSEVSAAPTPALTPTPPPAESRSEAAEGATVPASSAEFDGGLASVSGEDFPTLPPEIRDEVPSGWEGGGYPGDSVFIVTKSNSGTAHPSMLPQEDVTPEALIARIAELTGWDLTLAEPVTIGKGGMSVCLASTSSLFTGPPEPQKAGFHMYSAEQLAETLLDSIQITLQRGFTEEGGDPDNIDIYFYMEGEEPLTLPNIGLCWPIDEPYQWANAVPIE